MKNAIGSFTLVYLFLVNLNRIRYNIGVYVCKLDLSLLIFEISYLLKLEI